MNNWKEYLIVLTVNFLIGLLLSINCEGDGCMVIILAFFYFIAVVISFLPYLFYKPFKKINNEKTLAFFLPSALMIIFVFLSMKFGSNIPLNRHNTFSIGLVILPNTLLQLILFLINRSKTISD